VDVSQVLQKAFWALQKPFVLTSASISVAGKVAPFCQRLGLYEPNTPSDDLQTAVMPSPFDFENRCGLYLPEDMPAPTAPDFKDRFDDEVMNLLDLSGGGAFLLFTSYRAMRSAHERLSHRLLLRGIEVLMQGQKPKMTLLEEFKEKSEVGEVVLLATQSFWQGVDVQGKALRLVVIDRLPFKPPVDPLQRAKTQWIQKQNRSPFNDLALPQAAQILKQGTGRLMRHVDDAGIVAIMDGRLTQKSYGRVLKKSLPPFKPLDSFGACEVFWRETVIPALKLPDASDFI
jgi:ATP-dependent DNA helicase DinG